MVLATNVVLGLRSSPIWRSLPGGESVRFLCADELLMEAFSGILVVRSFCLVEEKGDTSASVEQQRRT